MNEIWRSIAGHPGYEVSNRGKVRSVDRVVTAMRRGCAVQCQYTGRILKLGSCRGGYQVARLGRSGRRARIHHLVLEAFVGARPAGHQAAHGDGNPRNNEFSNLRWATPSENAEDRRRHGTLLLGRRHHYGARTHCKNGHPFGEAHGTRYVNGRRVCATCQRDASRRHGGTPPWRFKEAFDLRLREGLRLMAEGLPAIRAAQIANVGRNALGKARRSRGRQ
jgi:hypothetical protein